MTILPLSRIGILLSITFLFYLPKGYKLALTAPYPQNSHIRNFITETLTAENMTTTLKSWMKLSC